MVDDLNSPYRNSDEESPEVLSSLPRHRPQRSSNHRMRQTNKRTQRSSTKKTRVGSTKSNSGNKRDRGSKATLEKATVLSQTEVAIKGALGAGLSITAKTAGAVLKRLRGS